MTIEANLSFKEPSSLPHITLVFYQPAQPLTRTISVSSPLIVSLSEKPALTYVFLANLFSAQASGQRENGLGFWGLGFRGSEFKGLGF